MVQEEVEAKTAKGSSSCTNGLLWLTRLKIILLLFLPGLFFWVAIHLLVDVFPHALISLIPITQQHAFPKIHAFCSTVHLNSGQLNYYLKILSLLL